MNDDQMDELLIQGARDYNVPGEVPREEMWARLSAARKAARTVPPVDVPQPRRVRTWLSLGVAAAAVLVVGIVIGRRLERPPVKQGPVVATTPNAPPKTIDSAPKVPANTMANGDSLI